MRISRATTALQNNLDAKDPETCAATFFRPEPTDKKPVALRVVGLSKRYGTTTAVGGLNFDIREGEIFGLLGPNGAGKTTTIAMLATQRLPSGGDATLFGHSACKEPSLVRQMIGLAPQEVSLYPALTAAENLQFFGRIYGVTGAELGKRIDELLALVGLDAHRDDQVSIFSGGMKRRLNLAVSLVHRPKLVLLDEPTAGVDPQSREQILKIIGGLRDDGNAILYTTHYMEEAERLCDRLGILSEGKLVAEGTLDSLLSGLEFAEIIELRGLPARIDLASMQAFAGVSHVERSDGVVRLYVKRATDFLWPLQKIISRSDQNVHLKIAPLSLENLFLHLTGTELRD
jgi:linearmycin/streptolysin S transport system ATP-binding protein